MFVILHFRDGREELLNPDCSAVNLLEYVKKVVDWDGEGDLDLCDSRGQPKQLSLQGNNNALATLTPNDTFFPVTLHNYGQSPSGMLCGEYSLLLDEDDRLYNPIRGQLSKIESAVRKLKRPDNLSPRHCIAQIVENMMRARSSKGRSSPGTHGNLLVAPNTDFRQRRLSGSARVPLK